MTTKEILDKYKTKKQIFWKISSDNKNVDKIWITGHRSIVAGEIITMLNIMMKDGERKQFRITNEQVESLEIPEAIEYLESKS